MKSKVDNLNGGYMMLLLVMIGLVLIITFAVSTDLFTGGEKGILEKGTDAVNDANEAKKKLEDNYRFDPDEKERSIDDLN